MEPEERDELPPVQPPHADWSKVEALWPYIEQYQALAKKHGIEDIFQDSGGKLLQTLLLTGLTNLKGRMGNDAADEEGREYELKSVNVADGRKNGFTTHHHLNAIILDKYRKVAAWYFSTYDGIELQSIHRMPPRTLEEPYFQLWERKIAARIEAGKSPDLNNPKIPVWFVRKDGELVYEQLLADVD